MPLSNFSLDLSGVPDQMDAVPEGEYTIMVEKVVFTENKDPAKSPYLSWTMGITGPAQVGRKLFMITSLAEKALWRLKANFKALGLPTDRLNFVLQPETGLILQPAIPGTVALAKVTIEKYDGRDQNRVVDLVAIDGAVKQATAPGMIVIPGGAPTIAAPAIATPTQQPVQPVQTVLPTLTLK